MLSIEVEIRGFVRMSPCIYLSFPGYSTFQELFSCTFKWSSLSVILKCLGMKLRECTTIATRRVKEKQGTSDRHIWPFTYLKTWLLFSSLPHIQACVTHASVTSFFLERAWEYIGKSKHPFRRLRKAASYTDICTGVTWRRLPLLLCNGPRMGSKSGFKILWVL